MNMLKHAASLTTCIYILYYYISSAIIISILLYYSLFYTYKTGNYIIVATKTQKQIFLTILNILVGTLYY